MGKTGTGSGFEEQNQEVYFEPTQEQHHPSTQIAVLIYHFPGLLAPGPGQEMHHMTPEHLKIPDSQE